MLLAKEVYMNHLTQDRIRGVPKLYDKDVGAAYIRV
jgi:hypothetical protein